MRALRALVVTTVLITRMVVHASQLDRALRVFGDMQADVRANESGTVAYDYYQSTDEPTVFWVHEVFADDDAKQAHLGRHGHRRADFDAILVAPPEFNAVSPI
jgi:quinol monooxygenase YgiN